MSSPNDRLECAACPNSTGDAVISCSACMQDYHKHCVSLPGVGTRAGWDNWTCTVCVGNSRVHSGNLNSPINKTRPAAAPAPAPAPSPAAPHPSRPAPHESAPCAGSSAPPPPQRSPAQTTDAKKPKQPAKKKRPQTTPAAAAATPAAPAAVAAPDEDPENAPSYYNLIKEEMQKGTERHNETVRSLKSDMERLTRAVEQYRATCEKLQASNDALARSVEFLGAEFERVKGHEARLAALERDNEALRRRLDEQDARADALARQADDAEQRSRANNMEIFNVPERNAERLPELVADIAKAAGLELKPEEVEYAVRVPPRPGAAPAAAGRPKPIVVRFRRRDAKDDLIRAVRKRRGVDTRDVGIAGDRRLIYLSDHLSPLNKALFARARAVSRLAGFKCWTSYSKIYVRPHEKANLIRIRSIADIERLTLH